MKNESNKPKTYLTNTVPMNTSAVSLHVVVHSDLDVITPVGADNWSGQLAIDEEAFALESTIGITGRV